MSRTVKTVCRSCGYLNLEPFEVCEGCGKSRDYEKSYGKKHFNPFFDTSMKGSENPIYIDSVRTWDKKLKENRCCLGTGATKNQIRIMKNEINDRAAASRAAK